MASASARPVLSLIVCSRNDEYQGNSRWRLETSLNYAAEQAEAIGRLAQIEVRVADWGSAQPLREVLRLTPAAARIVSFLHIPPGVATELQQDSPFPEVLALNAAARRARGDYIGRIDQDTLVGRQFLEQFFALHEGWRQLPVPLHEALLFSQRREIPYWFAVRCPSLTHVSRFIRLLGSRCRIAAKPRREFWTYFVGIWLVHRDIWADCGGYDERFIYYNWMEVEMILRLRQKYTLVDLGALVDCAFFHLDHRNPRIAPVVRESGRPVNTFDLAADAAPLDYRPNSDSWGLADRDLPDKPGLAAQLPGPRWFDGAVFTALLIDTGFRLAVDAALSRARHWRQKWMNRQGRQTAR